ncbi:MAG TPA: NAD(P)-binding domain-containing protein [Gemmatimonadaceae bacterium]|nr:NAD(P)-binding domain-containing protein [Gemmatimonadaceae bacterium]
MDTTREASRVDTVIIGAGQSGLSVGYYLERARIPFVILEARERVGDSWRHRWDSLRLFTPARYDGLVGMPFPAARHSFPTKDEMADYLAAYAERFALPVRTGVRVDRVTQEGDRYLVSAGSERWEARNVVVAMATYQAPKIPAFASELDPAVVQLHSSEYRNPAQLREGGVLVVGAGNSGAEIAIEVVRHDHETWLSGRDTGHVPFAIDGAVARLIVPVLFRVVFHRIVTVDTPIGRKARPNAIAQGGPLIRQRPRELLAAGVRRVGRTAGVRDGLPMLADGTVLPVANVIWCTGFHPGMSWLDVPVLDARGEPAHERGLVASHPGLYFVGLHFLYALSSTMIHGVARDAERIARDIVARALIGQTAGGGRSSSAARDRRST